MGATLILAKNTTEANAYARLVGLQRGRYRAVRNANSIRGVRHAEVHLLPSFLVRLDRHKILGELRWARTLEVYYVDPADLVSNMLETTVEQPAEPKSELPPADEPSQPFDVYASIFSSATEATLAFPEGGLLADTELLLDATHFFEETNGQTPTPQPVEDPAPAPQSRKGRRRSRCKACGTLHYKGDPCPEDAVDPIVTDEPVRVANEVEPKVDILGIIGAN